MQSFWESDNCSNKQQVPRKLHCTVVCTIHVSWSPGVPDVRFAASPAISPYFYKP